MHAPSNILKIRGFLRNSQGFKIREAVQQTIPGCVVEYVELPRTSESVLESVELKTFRKLGRRWAETLRDR